MHIHVTMITNRRNGILCVGFNHGFIHSEVDALVAYRHTCQRWHHLKTELWNARITQTGCLALSTPCLHCSRFIQQHLDLLHSISFTLTGHSTRTLQRQEFREFKFQHISRGNMLRSLYKTSRKKK